MIGRLSKIVPLLVLLLVPGGAGAGSEQDLAAIRKRIGTLEQDLAMAAKERPTARKALQQAETAEAGVQQGLRDLRQKIAVRRGDEARLRTEIGLAETRIAAERSALAAQLRLAWMSGRQEWLRVVLSQEDPAQLSRHMVHYGYITRERGALLQRLQLQAEALQSSTAALARELDELTALETRQTERARELTALRQVRRQALTTIERDLGSKQRKLAELRSNARRLQDLLARLERERRAAERQPRPAPEPAPAPAKGPQVRNLPLRGRMLSRFGQPRADGLLRWEGLLLGAPAGTEVRAVQAGRVIYADWLQGMGLLLVLDHGNGYMSLYGHNQDLLKKVGDRVRQGDTISRVGDSGGQSTPGLYFEMRRHGKPIDPKRWVR